MDGPFLVPKTAVRLLFLPQPPQGVLTSGAQSREIDLHDIPKPIFPDEIILVTQAVSGRSYLVPGMARHESPGQITLFSRSFADPFEAPLNSIVGFPVSPECRHVHAGDILWIACAFSMISSRRRAGLSEGKSAVSVDLCLEPLLAHRLFDDIHPAAENAGQAAFKLAQAA